MTSVLFFQKIEFDISRELSFSRLANSVSFSLPSSVLRKQVFTFHVNCVLLKMVNKLNLQEQMA